MKIAVISYLLIMLVGQMIALPFFAWLLFTLFDFGNIDQLFAFLAIIGLLLIYINRNKTRTLQILKLDILCLLLLASPLIGRMTAVPIHFFNDLASIIPMTSFVLFYTMSLFVGCREYSQTKTS